jgi:cyclopropane-fatty-acyl-phospholipid synthase
MGLLAGLKVAPTTAFRATAEKLLAGADIIIDGPRPWDIQVHDPRFYRRVFLQGSLGLGESYMDGWWDCEQLDEFICRVKHLQDRIGKGWTGRWNDLRNRHVNHQTVRRARRVAEVHYDLGNELFEATLGPTMAYTCGYWSDASDLDDAQRRKFRLICRKLGLKEGMRLLEIGCGWGELLRIAAAEFGVSAVGVTNSLEQLPAIRERCRGLPVDIRLGDYRELALAEEFDAVAIVGMIEHVGYRNYRTLMEIVHRALRPGGLFVLHTIGNNTTNLVAEAWIQKYIFPNGLTPSERQIAAAREGLFITHDMHNFGLDYDPTLMAWLQNFERNWPTLQRDYPRSYDDRFYRMWRFYLLSCAGGFRAGGPQLWQFVFSKGPLREIYRSVR